MTSSEANIWKNDVRTTLPTSIYKSGDLSKGVGNSPKKIAEQFGSWMYLVNYDQFFPEIYPLVN